MTVVFLDSTATSPWSLPIDWTNAGHQVELVGCGGTGPAGQTGTNAGSQSGGGGGAYIKLTAPVGTLGATTTFQVKATNASAVSLDTNATFWEGTTTTNTYEAQCGQVGLQASGLPLTTANGATNGTPSPVTYTTATHTGGAFGAETNVTFSSGGGCGAGGPDGNGLAGSWAATVSPGGGGGGGGANGGSATTPARPSSTSGGAGGLGNSGSGAGSGSTSTTSPNGTAGSTGGGGGGGAGSAASTAGQVGSGFAGGPLGNVSNWVQTSNGATAGAGGGGGGGGGFSANVAATSLGGTGGNYGGGGGGPGACRSAGSTVTATSGGGGLIVITYTAIAAPPSDHSRIYRVRNRTAY